MKLKNANSDIYIPDDGRLPDSITRTTHLGIGAHQDDLEFMAMHGILECYQRDSRWFGGITCTDGAGSARSGPYADYSDEQMKAVRVEEQRAAAKLGEYAFMAQLGYPSSCTKQASKRQDLVQEIHNLILEAQPIYIYTHNPFDKHASHIGVCLAVLEAIRILPADKRPRTVFGCEVWRALDWIPDSMKVIQPVDTHPSLAPELNGVFKSQIAGGKRYDLAVEGRRLANATFLDSYSVDQCNRAAYAIDLTPLTADSGPSIEQFTSGILDSFAEECHRMLKDLKT
ncbi:PIG-L family deacetylase [Puniceicoccales bacterium CK1056]|uniref:PIG-L family deacetylase n=1 Tax=Oceanipulchritudo coccoides TaxID=2706888 RepID=A0A6B2LZY6_9BACT|nr:PIG-L family deacetylase [Oceanipulchritudo coccoides]NDV61070.1 PIG-L family deacetylase [Oceanipulchritudo coccoides]